MRLLRRDSRPLLYFATVAVKDADGDKSRECVGGGVPFAGNLQPAKAAPEWNKAGFSPNYDYVCYTTSEIEFRELDRIGAVCDLEPQYELAGVENWGDYVRLNLRRLKR